MIPIDDLRRVLRGKSLTLRPFTEADVAEPYLSWLNDPDVTRFLEIRYEHQTPAMAMAFVRSFENADKYMWLVTTAEGRPIGTATVHSINRRHGFAELALMIGDKAHWGGTTAMEILNLLIAFCFGPLGLRKVTAGTYARHWGMNLIYNKLGFTRESTLRAAYLMNPGEYVDGYRWGLLASEWKGIAD